MKYLVEWRRLAVACCASTIAVACGGVHNPTVDGGPDDGAMVTYRVTVNLSGNGMGTVASSPAGLDCGSACVETYASGTAVTLTATPRTGSTFLGWSGGCSGSGTCSVTLTADVGITASFALDNSLGVKLAGNGTGGVTSDPAGINCGSDCSAAYAPGTKVVLTATPATGSVFGGWSGGVCTGTGSCSVTLTAAIMVIATFTLTQRTLTVTRPGTGAGTITSNPAGINCGASCVASFDFGTTVTLTAVRGDDVSRFVGWSGGGCSGVDPCVVSLKASTTVTVTFDRRGALYMIRDSDDVLQRMDPVTLAFTSIGTLGVNFALGDCAWDAGNSLLYMVPRGIPALYQVNPATGAATLIGTHGISDMRALAYNRSSGVMYAHGNGNLYSMNLFTGVATLVGPSAVGILDGLAWDSVRNRMIALSSHVANGTLYTINLSTGAATFLGAAGPFDNAGLTYDPMIDRHWGVDFAGRLIQYNPAAGMARTDLANMLGQHTCITFRP